MTTLTLRDAVEVVLEGYTLHEGARKILETAIAQEKANKNGVPIELVRFGGRCNIHPLNILPCAACEEMFQRKLDSTKTMKSGFSTLTIKEPKP